MNEADGNGKKRAWRVNVIGLEELTAQSASPVKKPRIQYNKGLKTDEALSMVMSGSKRRGLNKPEHSFSDTIVTHRIASHYPTATVAMEADIGMLTNRLHFVTRPSCIINLSSSCSGSKISPLLTEPSWTTTKENADFGLAPVKKVKQKPIYPNTTSKTKHPLRFGYTLSNFIATIVVAIAAIAAHTSLSGTGQAKKDSICVSGGGFSGFWFTLGRLDSLLDPSTKNYYCYSAGCLGVVAALSNYSMEDMWGMAHGVQNRWKSGEIGRYEVVRYFVDDLLYGNLRTDKNISSPLLDSKILARLNILTTVKDGWFGVKTSSGTPMDIQSLHTMLVQTAWIPFATGDDLWHDGHMDGAFSIPYHPSCEHNLGLTLDLDLIANVVNVNLGRTKVEKLWKKGLAYGL